MFQQWIAVPVEPPLWLVAFTILATAYIHLCKETANGPPIEKACAHRFFATVWRGNARRGSSTRLLYMDFLAIRLLEGKQEGRAY